MATVIAATGDSDNWESGIDHALFSAGDCDYQRFYIDITRLVGTIDGLCGNDRENHEAIDAELAEVRWTLPQDAEEHKVLLFAIYSQRRKVYVRECGFVPLLCTSFSLNSLATSKPASNAALPDANPVDPEPAVEAQVAPVPVLVPLTVQVEVFRLPLATGMAAGGSGALIKVTRALEVAKAIVALLPLDDGDVLLLPTRENLAIIGNTDTFQPAEWDAALTMLLTSVSRTRALVQRFACAYRDLVRQCAEADATFLARMRTHNPEYFGCLTVEMMAMRAATNAERLGDLARSRYHSFRAAVRCFALLLDDRECEGEGD